MDNFKEKVKFLENNNLGVTGLGLDILENADLEKDKDFLIDKITKASNRYKNNTSKYPEHIMEQLRLYLGAEDKYSTSLDSKIENMTKEEVFTCLLTWNGLKSYKDRLCDWLKLLYDFRLEE